MFVISIYVKQLSGTRMQTFSEATTGFSRIKNSLQHNLCYVEVAPCVTFFVSSKLFNNFLTDADNISDRCLKW